LSSPSATASSWSCAPKATRKRRSTRCAVSPLKTGACKPLLLSEDERAKVWLYRAGDEAYRQPTSSAGYVFIDPVPRPEKFGA
jgi:hypothetical protein